MKKITTEYVREKFPECISFADSVRDAFGAGVKLTYMKESGREISTRAAMPEERTLSLDRATLFDRKDADAKDRNPSDRKGRRYGRR